MSDLKDRMPTPGKAVEVREVEVPAGSAPAQIRKAIEAQSKAFHAVLPASVDPERFARLVLTAVKASPELLQCFGTVQGQTSLLLAAMQAAAMGIAPNTPAQHCWLLPRKKGQVQECELQIGYRGYLHLARKSNTVKTIYAQVVREGDHFRYERGLDNDILEWRPCEDDRGDLIHVFAVVRYLNGGANFVVLNKRQVEARRAVSPSFRAQNNSSSPWIKWPEEMWGKTAIRALIPHLELDEQMAVAENVDERTLRIDDEGIIDVAEALELGSGDTGPSGGDTVGIRADGGQETAVLAAEGPASPPDAPRGQAEVAAGPSEVGAGPPGSPPPASSGTVPEPMSQGQSRALHALLKRKMNVAGDERHPVLSGLLERPIASASDLSWADASTVIDLLNDMEDHEPATG